MDQLRRWVARLADQVLVDSVPRWVLPSCPACHSFFEEGIAAAFVARLPGALRPAKPGAEVPREQEADWEAAAAREVPAWEQELERVLKEPNRHRNESAVI